MAIGKLHGVESVDVSLTRASADVRLRPGNTVTLAQLRKIIKDNGFSSRDVTVTAVGRLVDSGGTVALDISGLVLPLARDSKQPAAYDDAVARAKSAQPTVEVTGVVPTPKNNADQMLVTSVRPVTQ